MNNDAAVCDPRGIPRGLTRALYQLLCRDSGGGTKIQDELVELVDGHGKRVYSELLHLLCHLRFDPGEAEQHWERIVEYRELLSRRLETEVDLRVAMTSYFVEVNRHLHNPKIIELKLFTETQQSACRDDLTGLCNHRLFREHLDHEVQKCHRDNSALSLVMIDIDNFKQYNDRYGHETGNRVLKLVARLLESSSRDMDIAARYGGEEFALILPATSKVDAFRVADRAREQIARHAFPHGETQPGGRLSVSMGIATCPADAGSSQQLVERADQALYVAKARGKNQAYLYGQDRRSFRRIDASLDGQFCVLAAEFHPLTTVNISEHGFLLHVDRKLDLGALIDIKLILPKSKQEIQASGRVVRVEEDEVGRYAAAIRIVEIGRDDRLLLNNHIRELGADEPTDETARG